MLRQLAMSLPLFAIACHGGGSATPTAKEAWVRLPAVQGRPGAAYLTVEGGAQPARIVAVDSGAAGASELHESMGQGGMTTMHRLSGIDLPARGEVRFAPGGNHVMLFGLDGRLKPGSTVPLTVRFAEGPPVQLQARAVGAGDGAPY